MPSESLWADSKWFKLSDFSNQMKGRFGERWIAEDLQKLGRKAEVKVDETSYDVLVDDSIEVEVKLAMARKEGEKLILDFMQWQHLNIQRSDVYAFIGINPEHNFRVRRGWREEVEESFILYFTSEQLQELYEQQPDNEKLLEAIKGNKKDLQTTKPFLKRINYGADYREFPL